MEVTHAETMALKALVEDSLTEIEAVFAEGNPSADHTIHELSLGMDEGGELIPLFSYTNQERVINFAVLGPIMFEYYLAHPNGIQSGEIFGLPDQEGEDFDFFLALKHKGKNYFLFANYLLGTLQNLESNPSWAEARALFIALGSKMVKIIDPIVVKKG